MQKFSPGALRAERERQGLLLHEVAQRVRLCGGKLSAAQLCQYESGAVTPGADKAALIADALRMDVGKLYTKNDKKRA